ncbi:MAG: HPr family phosphocarrier protein [Pseudomonadota bacterium]|nr:HPr family phosphocarrier protein [Pseudomonadota bacterium]
MPSSILMISNRLGLHARAAAKFVQMASRFASEVSVKKDGNAVNGKSVMGIMMLAAAQGAEIEIRTEGEDADEALASLESLVTSRFGEAG